MIRGFFWRSLLISAGFLGFGTWSRLAVAADGKVDPCLSKTFSFDEIGEAHQLMRENKHPYGNMACLVNATDKGLGRDNEFR